MELLLNGLGEVILLCAGFIAGFLFCLHMQGPNDPPEDGDYLVTTKEQLNSFLRKAQGMVNNNLTTA